MANKKGARRRAKTEHKPKHGCTVVIYTCAYNAERTLARTAGSIFAQSYPNWIWYIVDNGSTDATGGMIEGFARRDARVRPLANRQNHVWERGNRWCDVISGCAGTDYLCWLDADDEYKPEFLEEMIGFSVRNSLDIAACGIDFVSAGSGRRGNTRAVPVEVIIEGERFSQLFTLYHQFMRTCWGKLYSVALMRRVNNGRISAYPKIYGWDTFYVFEHMRAAARVGLYPKALHRYYLGAATVSYQWEPRRFKSDCVLHRAVQKFLMEKCGEITPKNADFLMLVYLNAIRDTLNVLMNARLSDAETLKGMLDILLHRYTVQLAQAETPGRRIGQDSTEKRAALFGAAAHRLLALREVPDELAERYFSAGELACDAAGVAEQYMLFAKLRLRFLIGAGRADEARARLAEWLALVPDDAEFLGLLARLETQG